ncbi:MAG: hypothetical protein GXY80_10925 [Syntrophorhabdus aromaticivorans]|uniref:Uncharacterized protein n=1 Tax=Syntrophorhabdus aromaticivorans TaxID=328301 RepID=A0A971S112_9BACT|nr:hypothetical protein [Syntrophorhabdus aromaticivorans]
MESKSVWPRELSGPVSWESKPSDLAKLTAAAAPVINRVVTKPVFDAARDKVDVLTIGIDLFSGQDRNHIELVAVFDMRAAKLVRWTGKSYPTSDQEKWLVQVVNLDTHLLSIAGERVLVLGCHDLNMYNPRGRENQNPGGSRRERCDEMRAKVKKFQPSVVLHHPHSTDTPNIWNTAWNSLRGKIPNVKAWASGICYYNYRNEAPRASLERVLKSTQGGAPCLDIKC